MWWFFQRASVPVLAVCAAVFWWQWQKTQRMAQELSEQVERERHTAARYQKEVSGQTGEAEAARASASVFQNILIGGLDNLNSAYNALGRATVRIGAGNNVCHGVLARFRGEVFILTAAHCVGDGRESFAGEVWFSEYLQETSGGQDNACDGKNCYEGYGFIPAWGTDAEFVPGDVAADRKRDVAAIRGVKKFRIANVRRHALAIAEKNPEPLQFAYGVHWQPFDWGHSGQESAGGVLLIPNLGIVRECPSPKPQFAHQEHFCEYALSVYAGDSGSGIVNEFDELIGIISRSIPDKASKVIRADACGPHSLRAFLAKQHW